jgi:hypothetical protein
MEKKKRRLDALHLDGFAVAAFIPSWPDCSTDSIQSMSAMVLETSFSSGFDYPRNKLRDSGMAISERREVNRQTYGDGANCSPGNGSD